MRKNPVEIVSLTQVESLVKKRFGMQVVPAVPDALPPDVGQIYVRDDGSGNDSLYYQDPAGVEYLLSASGGDAPADAMYLVNGTDADLPNAIDISADNVLDHLTLGTPASTIGSIRLKTAAEIVWRDKD